MLPPNSLLQNRYRVVRELGHGGMGTVYEAIDQRVNCIVALKETIAGNNEDARRAFEREASLLGNLRHSALPKVMDYFIEETGDFLVMEFIPGYDLAELLESREGAFPQSQVLRWADELLRVLEYLHRQEPPILHRDIKPSNLKLTKQGEIFLLDFGLAKGSIGQMPTLATSRSVRGYTPVYASLEQIHGQGSDARSDIYSLGATLYHLLTSVAPVDAPTRFHAVEDDQPDPLQPIEKLNPQASANVAAVIHQAMALSRKQRPISAAEMRKALRNAAEEDERAAAEGEYRRAEAKRQQRDAARRQAEEEAGRKAEEERQRQEQETREKEEEASRQVAERRRQDETERQRREAENREAESKAARRRAEEEAKQKYSNLLSTIPSPSPPPIQQPLSQAAAPPLAIKTIPARPPDGLSMDSGGTAFAGESTRTNTAGSKRVFVIAAGLLAVVVAGAISLSPLRDTALPSSSPATPTRPETSPGSQPSEIKPPEGMVYIPGGAFMMGRDNGDEAERPAHQVTVKPFFIDTHEVTNEDYERFVKATGHRSPASWKKGSFPSGAARKPVTGVTWGDATDFARWAGKRLPTEEEWEFGARGTDGRLYPWGNDWRRGSANANDAEQSMADVGEYKGTSPFGAYDMVGNAWEWTSSIFRAYPGGHLPANKLSGELRVIRSGTYDSTKAYATTTYRTGWPAQGARTYDQTGFRCVQDIAP